MSAANASAPSASLQEEIRAHEPSMEEILASIRRIIADDESLPGVRRDSSPERRADNDESPSQAYPAPVLEEQSEDVGDIVDNKDAGDDAAYQETVEAPPASAEVRHLRLATPEPEPELEAADFEADFAAAIGLYEHRAEPQPVEAADLNGPLMSSDAASAIASQFQALATSMFVNDSGLLQKYAQEMMRPMLKQWLDDNLPVIVERLVRAEIERVARGGRR